MIECNNKDELELRKELSAYLMFPDYYSENWDSFAECISDLNWLEANEINIQLKSVDVASSAILVKVLLDAYDNSVKHKNAVSISLQLL